MPDNVILTNKETEMFNKFISGLSAHEIGLECNITTSQVYKHLNKIVRKFDLADRDQLHKGLQYTTGSVKSVISEGAVLTAREERILKAHLRGANYTAIAEICGVTASTATSRLHEIMRKFGLESKEQLTKDLVYTVVSVQEGHRRAGR